MNRKLKVEEIARLVQGEFTGDGSAEIFRVASIEKARENEIAFFDKTDAAFQTNAACLIVPQNFDAEFPRSLIRVKNPKLAFARVAAVLHPPKQRTPEIHLSAVISETATVGKEVFVGAFVCVGENSEIGDGTHIREGAKIGDDVKIGANCVIHPNVVLEDGVTIGARVILHAGVVIGADGFGYVPDAGRHVKFPQIGTVIIEDDVEIGANSCIDRGALGETRIGRGTKIDNLVQIAHNDLIGENVIIAAMTGLSGSVELGDGVVLAGQVGIADHVRIEAGAVIGAKSAVFPHKVVRPGVWAGIPAVPLAEYKRQNAYINSIARLRETVKKLKKEIERLQNEETIS